MRKLAACIIPPFSWPPALGKTHAVVFDSGYEAWLYAIPASAGRYAEFVVLLDPRGVVAKTRLRAPSLPEP